MSKIRYIIGLCCFLLFSCQPTSHIDKIKKYYEEHRPKGHFEKYKKVIVISELGKCKKCNSQFSLQSAQYLNYNDILFIVTGIGTKVDISPYIDISKEDLIWDIQSQFDNLNIVKACAIIDLSNGKITEVTPENVDNIDIEILK